MELLADSLSLGRGSVIKPVLSFTLSGKHITYTYTHTLIRIYNKHITVTDIRIIMNSYNNLYIYLYL